MHIVLLNHTHETQIAGGGETRFRLLDQALTEAGHTCHQVATRQDAPNPMSRVRDAVRQADLVIQDPGIPAAGNCPIITIWGNPWRMLSENQWQPLLRPIYHNAIAMECKWRQRPSIKVAVSNFMAQEEMQRGAGIVADHVLPNPADLDRFADLPQPGPRETIVWVGSHHTIKNSRTMHCTREIIRRMSLTQQWQSIYKIRSRLSKDEMTQEYQAAAVVVSTSLVEGCSHTLLEAMAANVPIVATKTGLFWDWWDPRLGERVENPTDPHEFAQAIKRVCHEPERYAPRQVAMEAGLDYATWARRWQRLVWEAAS